MRSILCSFQSYSQHVNMRFIMSISAFVLFVSCGETDEERQERVRQEVAQAKEIVRQDSLRRLDSLKRIEDEAMKQFPEIPYTTYQNISSSTMDSIRRVFRVGGKSDTAKILKLMNRKEMGYIRAGTTVVVPTKIVGDLRAYSVFPQYYPGAALLPKIIVISNKYQSYACYEYGKLVRFAACNTGTKGKPTFPGRYACNWKQELRISSLNDNWKLPFTVNFHLFAGNAFHQFAMPGRPVSHSCVRQFMDDAKWLFRWVKIASLDSNRRPAQFTGTPVIILDMFNFNRKSGGPWHDLTSNRDNILKLPDDPMAVEEALIPISQIPHDARGGLSPRKRYLTAQDTLIARGVIDSTFRLSESIDYNKLRGKKRSATRRPSRPSSAPPVTLTPPSNG